MTSIAHNGFACPNCRTAMAEVPEEEEDEDDEDEFDDEEDTLRAFRFFMNNINEEKHNEEDIEEEEAYLAYINELDEVDEPEVPIPSSEIITERLTQQGVTMEDLVKILMLNHDEYQLHLFDNSQFERLEGEVFGKMRVIISNFNPESL
jgi:hypothetical protein